MQSTPPASSSAYAWTETMHPQCSLCPARTEIQERINQQAQIMTRAIKARESAACRRTHLPARFAFPPSGHLRVEGLAEGPMLERTTAHRKQKTHMHACIRHQESSYASQSAPGNHQLYRKPPRIRRNRADVAITPRRSGVRHRRIRLRGGRREGASSLSPGARIERA